MKNKLSKRILSLFLSLLMVVTSIPAFAVTASASGMENCKYLFAYFTDNSKYGQKIRFAVSEDGYNFTKINDGKPVITQTKSDKSSSAGYARDPYIFPSHDGKKWYIICTDMDATGVHSSWSGDTCFVMWESTDLLNWTQMDAIDVTEFGSVAGVGDFSTTIRAWAPQVIYDDSVGKYMMYWSNYMNDVGGSGTNWNNPIVYSYTTDFKTFETPQVLYRNADGGQSIDGDIQTNGNGIYYLYYKDESQGGICYVKSQSMSGPYNTTPVVISQSTEAVEGCNSYQIGNTSTYGMIIDEYDAGNFFIQTTDDMESFTRVDSTASNISTLGARHGSIIQITDEQYQSLLAYDQWPTTTFNTIKYNWDQAESKTTNWADDNYTDSSGFGYSVCVDGNGTGLGSNAYFKTANGAVELYGANIFIRDGNVNAYTAFDEFSVSFTHVRFADTYGNNVALKDNGVIFTVSNGTTDYLQLKEDGTIFILSNGKKVPGATKADIPVGVAQDFLITYGNETTKLYVDGKLITTIKGKIDDHSNTYGALGFSDSSGVRSWSAYSALTYYENDLSTASSFDTLKSAMKAYEDKMGGTVYTNMGNAYDAYVKCNKAYDAYYYGGDESVDMFSPAYELQYATYKMQP
ncbi:MAG: hypothetical protein PUE08_06745, partial [Eubacteriales bacterium]|nr:hypothetical protein [Eubacteriales bacterium]